MMEFILWENRKGLDDMNFGNAAGTPAYVAGMVIGAVGVLVIIAVAFKGKLHF